MSTGHLSIREKREEIGPVEMIWWARPIGKEFFLSFNIRTDKQEGASAGFEIEWLSLAGFQDIKELQGREAGFDIFADQRNDTRYCYAKVHDRKYLLSELKIRFGQLAGENFSVQWDALGTSFREVAVDVSAGFHNAPKTEIEESDVPLSAGFNAEAVNFAKKLKPPMQELLDLADDFEMCNGVFKRVGAWHGRLIDVSKCSPEERVVLQVWDSAGIIGNGGFQYLFEASYYGDPGFIYTAAAFRALGCKQAAEAFEEALALFPRNSPPDDIKKRLAIYQAVPEAERERIDRKFCDADKEMMAKLARYIRANRAAFKHLP